MAPGIMCFGSRKSADPDTAKNEQIEKMIRADKKKAAKEVKLLLLGAGESGKSTVLKQMRLMHSDGFSRAEREQWRVVIFNNLVHAFQVIFSAMQELEQEFSQSANLKNAELIAAEPELNPDSAMPLDYLGAFKSLWDDGGVQYAIVSGNEYALHDNLNYYFKDIDRLFHKDYIPTDQDILRARLRTTGISETFFDCGSLTYRMFDVGGQRSERKKWIHVFDNVNAVLFLVAISGYDHVLVEDRNGNQMHEALMLFESISNSKYFEKAALILFLNKMDLFREKIASGQSPMERHFPDYSGPPNDVRAAQEYFASKFRKLVRQQSKEVYVHYTNATDTDLLKRTMDSVQDMIVQRNLNELVL